MISISKAHYDSLIELIHLTNRNLTLLAPNALVGLAQNWAHLNTQLEALYHKIDN